MIKKDATVIIRTNDAIYSPCTVLSINDKNVTVVYFAGMKRDRKTGVFTEEHVTKTISLKTVLSMSERI